MRVTVFVCGHELSIGHKAERIVVETSCYALRFKACRTEIN